MTAKALESIEALLQQLHGHGYFRPQDGPLKSRLVDAVAAELEGDLVEDLARPGLDMEVSIGRHELDQEVCIDLKLQVHGRVFTCELALGALNGAELTDLEGCLGGLLQQPGAPAEAAEGAGKNILRKKVEGDYHEQGAAAARLKVTPQWLKSVVPCTDYSYDEIDGKKYIRDYFWSKELIENLFRIKSTKTTPEDLQYVAQECCEGDLDWARDLIARIKSPNRVEQGREGQKVQQGQQKAGGPAANAPGPGGGEPRRNRSRHRRSRDGSKDQGRKPQPPNPNPK
jgi:hypothetical protein